MRLELSTLADFSTLEALVSTQGVDGLLAALDETRAHLTPEARWRSEDGLTLGPRTLHVLRDAVALDADFLRAHPETLFQCLYNRLRWFDAPDAAEHYDASGPAPWALPEPHLFTLAARWRRQWEARGDSPWLESLRPLPGTLGSDDPLLRHGMHVLCAAYDPSGTRLATGAWSDGRNVFVWDGATGRQLLVTEGHECEVLAIAWSADGKRLATGSRDHDVRLWDAETGALLHAMTEQEGRVTGVAFSPEGRVLATTNLGWRVRLFDTASGQVLRTLEGHEQSALCVAFHPSGRWLASGASDGTARIWDAASGEQLARFEARPLISSLAFSPDGAWLALTRGYQGIALLETQGWTHVRTLQQDTPYSQVAWLDDTRLGVLAHDRVEVLDARSGDVLRQRPYVSDGNERSVAFHPAGRRYALTSADGTVHVSDLEAPPPPTPRALRNGVYALWARPDGEVGVARRNEASLVIDARGRSRPLPADDSVVYGQPWAFSPDGRWIAYPATTFAEENSRAEVRLLEVETLGAPRSLFAPPEEATGESVRERPLAFSPDGRLLAAVVEPGAVRIWHLPEGTLSHKLPGPAGDVLLLSFTCDGAHLLVGSRDEQHVWVYEVKSGARVLDVPSVESSCMLASRAPCLVVGRPSGELELVDLPTGTRRSIQTLGGPIDKVAISPEGTRVAALSADQVVRVFAVRTGALLHELPHPFPDYLTLEGLSLTRDLLVTRVSQEAARFFDLGTDSLRAELRVQLSLQDVVEQPLWSASDDKESSLHRRLDPTPLVRFAAPLGDAYVLRGGLVVGLGRGPTEREFLYVLQLHDGN